MKINREQECKSFKMNSSRQSKELSSFREAEVLVVGLRPGKDPTDLLLGDNTVPEQDQEITHTEVMAQGTLVEDQLKSLELHLRIADLSLIT